MIVVPFVSLLLGVVARLLLRGAFLLDAVARCCTVYFIVAHCALLLLIHVKTVMEILVKARCFLLYLPLFCPCLVL